MSSVVAERLVAPLSAAPFTWPSRRALLTAEWRHLVMLNYEIDPQVLQPLIPQGTQLDFWHGRTYVSIVGFLFLRTRLLGVSIPFHANFEEVNLRFYVRRDCEGECRRGVTFVRELVPRRAVSFVANTLYGENYRTAPMSHRLIDADPAFVTPPREVEYAWKYAGRAHRMALRTSGVARPLEPGSLDEFIAEHYWGYTALGPCAAEYQVAHPSWRVSSAASVDVDVDVAALYGPTFAPFLRGEPASAFWADGSPVRVYRGTRLRADAR